MRKGLVQASPTTNASAGKPEKLPSTGYPQPAYNKQTTDTQIMALTRIKRSSPTLGARGL